MPQYSIQGPDGKTYSIEGPVGATREEVIDAIEYRMRQSPQPEEESGFGRQLLDIPVQAGKGVVTGVKSLTNIFGADNLISEALSGVEGYMDSLLSAQAKNDQKEIARIMAEAEDKGVAERVLAGAKAFATAPVDIMSQALGTAVPAIAGGLYANLLKLGKAGVIGVQSGIGALMGTGLVKGTIYESVKDALIGAGESSDVAEKKASEAQSFGGENWGSILGGTALGALAGSTGIERMIVNRFAAKKAAEETAKGIGRRAIEGGVTEFTPEFFQAAQEQVAANLALQKEGFDVDTFRGAIEQGTLEGLAGFGLGAGIGAVTGRRAAAPGVTPPSEPKVTSTNIYEITDFDGNPSQVTVTQDDAGNIFARDDKGEEIDLTNVVSTGVSIEDAVKKTFSPEDAPAPVIAKPPEIAPQPEIASAPEITPPEVPAAPEITVPKAPAAPEVPVAPTPSVLTPDAEALLDSVDAGGIPGFVTNNLRRIAQENGITVTASTTPDDIIAGLRAKKTAAPETVAPEAVAPEAPVAEPVQEPRVELPTVEDMAPPVSTLGDVETGKPFTFEGFRGEGKPKKDIYTGARIAVGGEGRYIADTEESAKNYGDKISRETVTLNNPLVIRNDDEWRALTRQAGWKYPNPFSLEESVVKRMTEALATLVKGQGYDGIVIDMDPRGDMAKTLYNVFGHPQIISYKPAATEKSEIDAGFSENPEPLYTLPEFPTRDEQVRYYFTQNKNVKRTDIVIFDDMIGFKQSDQTYNNMPDGSGGENLGNIDDIRETMKNVFRESLETVLMPKKYFEIYSKLSKPLKAQTPTKEVEVAPSSAAKKTSDFIDAEVEALGPPPAGENPKQSTARRINETKAAWKKYQAFAKELPPEQRFNEGQFKMVFDRRRRSYEEKSGTRPAPTAAPVTELPMASSEAELGGRINATPKERRVAEELAEELLGEVVWQQGNTSMLRVADPKYGNMRYIASVGRRRTSTDVRSYTGKLIPFETKVYLRDLAEQLEADARAKHNANPYVKFSQGISVSEDIDPKIEGVLRGWRKELGMNAKIHITTLDAVKRNRNKYTGPHRSIIGGALNPYAEGYMQKWEDGNYHIVFTKSTSLTRMLETIAHELGHIHQREVFEQADPATKKEITAAYNRFLVRNKPKNIRDYVHSLRAKTTAQISRFPEGALEKPSMGLTPYWRSFSEWYADQVSRWAVSSEKPVGVVEQFFARLAQALRKFYKTVKGQGYLPDETFVQYLNKVKSRAQILPSTIGEASKIEEQGLSNIQPSEGYKVQAILPEDLPQAKKMVGGLYVGDTVSNRSSIDSSLDSYKILGIREVPYSVFEDQGAPIYANRSQENYTKELADKISESQKLNPLIVVYDKDGYYILEGSHRFDALKELGIKSFPALVVKDTSEDMGVPDIEFSEMLKKLPPGRSEELRQAAVDLADGKITSAEFDEMVNKYRPIVARQVVPKPKTEAEMKEALNVTQREKVNPQIAENTPVGTRLDIEATKKGVPVVTIHTKRPGGVESKSVGKVIGFKSVAKIRDVTFSPGNSSESLEMAMGRRKQPLQTMEGRWVNVSPDDAYAEATSIFASPEWTEIGIDPTRHSYFYDKRNTQPVTNADEVIQIGDAVFAKNVKYAAKEEFLYSEGKPIVGRSDALRDAANQLQEGLITAQEFDSLVNQYKPIRVPQGVRTPNSREEVANILKANQKPMAFPDIPEGTRVGTRLDIDSTRKGVPVVAIHQPKPNIGSAKQPIIGYDSVARLTDVQFAVGNQVRALKIASGAFKEPLQTMEGSYSKITPDQAVAIAQASLNDPSWTQVGVDPERHAYFYDKKNTDPVVSADEIIQIGDQVFAKNVVYAPKEEFLFSQRLSPEAAGKMALDVVNTLGRGLEPEKTNVQRLKEAFVDDKGNVKLTPENAKKAATKWMDQIETWAFSSDAALNNAIRRTLEDTTKSQQEKIGVLLSISSSQAVHADAVASLFLRYGGIRYNPETYKYEAVDNKDNLITLVKAIDELATKYKMSKEQAERVAHTAFEAKRLRSLQDFNDALSTQVEEIRARIAQARTEGDLSMKKLLEAELRRKMKDFKFIHMTEDEINAGLSLIDLMPKEMNKIIDTWNGMRLSAGVELIKSGLWTVEEAEILLSNIDYVPFYREDQLEQGKGPKEFLRGLQVQAKEKKLKGSKLAVNDIFDNIARWTQYSVKRAVMNRLAVAKIDAAVEAGIAQKVKEAQKGKNSVRVWRDGVAEFYNLNDPLFMEAFAGLESISIPTWKLASKFSDFLRQSVVLNPLFSLSQVPQDAFAAIYTSGLKPRFALSIPARAVKEFVLTLFKASKTNKDLERIGIVGIRDFTSAIARTDAEVAAGLRSRPGVWNKVKGFLEHISMASDNAVRQAVYEASIAQGVSRAEALEKAFQLINFRNRGSSKMLSLAGQVIPFFNAYLAAQHVAIKTISGVGISPTDRKEALKTLAYTTAAMTTLALIYSMMMDDDEEYKDTPSIIRDRLLMIPGTKMSIPIRPDIFAIPKIITEHTYMMMTNQGSADGRKFRDSLKAALGNSLFSPTVVPQAIKPVVEVGINYNFFQGRPLVGTYQKGLETERQFNDSTSELAKILGNTGAISPIAADHLIRGMLGSVGGLTLFLTNGLLHSDPSVPRPEMTVREALAALPSTSGFVRREYETGLKNDFYVLRDEVSKAVNTLNDMKARSPHEIEEFLADEKNINRIGLQKATNKITKDLSTIRREISRITQSPDMSAREKQQAIKELREIERDMLSGIDIKELRRMAQL